MVWYKQTNNSTNSKEDKKSTTVVLTLESKSPVITIKDFVRYCYEKHIDEVYPDDMEHHYYVMNRDDKDIIYFSIENTKQLSHIFIPGIDKIIKLIDIFNNKTGYFAIPGIQHKLGFILYGPPGTGKTSFIKALSNYTQRSVINVRLNTINNATELMGTMFGPKITIKETPFQTRSSTVSVPLNKRIYVFEDIDAMSSIINKRTDNHKFLENIQRNTLIKIKN